MTKRILAFCALGIGSAIGLASPPAWAQQRGAAATGPQRGGPQRGAAPAQPVKIVPNPLTAPKPPYVVPKTSWGEPDLQGTWPLTHLITTRLTRAANAGERRFMTDEEYSTALAAASGRIDSARSGSVPGSETGPPSGLTSLISDPPNGQFPELTPKGKEMNDNFYGSYKPRRVNGREIYDSLADFDTWDRCVTRGLPVSMLTRNYNVGLRLMQSPGYVVIFIEMAHEARIIPTDGRPALDPTIKQYLGESRGHWEGNTLVVETTNFNAKPAQTNLGVPGAPALTVASEALHIVERFTRTGPETVDYKMTIEDPVVLTRPWTVEFPWKLDPTYDIYEYACHEGNTAVRNYIETSRFERANPQPAAPAGARGAGAPGGAAPGGRGARGGATPPAGNQ